ncbi:hypothetical protein TESG_04277 [Trichophyton tonsurans CBS 112818]|uniref:Membrane insertase YidC/Oxa/ALB C-terminal domain-containing protein n=1 Tax=Trichophyton tonsurans (strain CBS 112818) TaxID=647933 RepID=F2RZQ0_TRIT1|nr:hypothetical protein TESG_04277 [Trichophyton tonsurans CBS 112818]
MSLMRPRLGLPALSSFGCSRVSIAALSRRNFHASNPNRIIDSSVLVAHDVIQGFHSITGLPWLNPLLLTWSRVCQKKAMDEAFREGRHLFPKAIEASWQQDFKMKRKELYKRWKIRPWASYASILQLPVWLAMMESLRRMVGMSGGLLSIIQSWIESKVDGAPIIEVEPSMATEGALWFTDLLIADPTHALPVVLAATMFTNVTWGWKVKSAAEISKLQRSEAIRERAFKTLKRVLQGLSIWLAPVMIYSQAPAGLLIYWISSSTFATAQTQIVRRVMRTKAPPAPCREKSVGSIHDKTSSTAFK